MNIAFCINKLGMIGLGATVTSLLRSCSEPDKLVLWFLCAGLSDDDKRLLVNLFNTEGFGGRYVFIDFNPNAHFSAFNSLHGDWTAYGRLLLADFIDEEQVLYLDSDLIVELDVLSLNNFNFKGQALAAVGGGIFRYTLGYDFYVNKVGLAPDLEYFNSGVLLINLREWRLRSIKEECLEIARKYTKELPSHDQSILNILCAGNFTKLPKAFNSEWPSFRDRPCFADKMIFHFVGSPKPWDPLGAVIHKGYGVWKGYSGAEWLSHFDYFTYKRFNRIWNLRRSYARSIMDKLRN